MIQTLAQQAITPEKPFSEVWGPSIIMGSVGLIVGLTSAILAYRVASRGLTNILNAQSDKHRKDLEREGVSARRQREENRLLRLVDEYTHLFTIYAEFYKDLEILFVTNKGRMPQGDIDNIIEKGKIQGQEREQILKKLRFMDFDPKRRDLVSQLSGTINFKADRTLEKEELSKHRSNVATIETAISESLRVELHSLP